MVGTTDPMGVNWDVLEDAGHDFVLVSPVMQGLSHYVCENCGTLMVTYQGQVEEVWHHPHREDRVCEPRGSTGQTLDQKLMDLRARQLARMVDI